MKKPVLTSLYLEILHYFCKFYDVAFIAVALALFIYKGTKLPYPGKSFPIELFVVLMFVLVEPVRLQLGSKGNLTEAFGPLAISVLLGLLLLAYYIYYMFYQTYVLRLEQVLYGIPLALQSLQLLIGCWTLLKFLVAKTL